MAFLQDLPALVLSGLASGSTYALLALGIVIIFRSTDTINFAVGHIGVLAVYAATPALGLGLPLPLVLAGTVGLGGLLGVAAQRALVQPIAGRLNFPFVALVVTIGLSLVIHAGIGAVFGHPALPFPPLVPGTVAVGGFALTWNKVAAGACAVAAMAAVALFFGRSPLGIGMRASAEDPFAARLVGLEPRRIADLAWFIGCALATLAMVFLAADLPLTASLPDNPLFRAFAGVFLGGLTSMAGAVVGGFVIGVLDNLAGAYVSPNFRDTIVFGTIVVVLALRPAGLFGTVVRARV